MKITLIPQRRDTTLSLEKTGDVLSVNGEAFDFSALQEGDELPPEAIASDLFAGPVTRQDGVLHLSLILPHGPNAPQETLFPIPKNVTDDGPIKLPPHDAEEFPA